MGPRVLKNPKTLLLFQVHARQSRVMKPGSSQVLKAAMTRFWTPKLVVTDWDETITQHDTISLVAEAAYIAKPTFSPKFDYFSQVYLDAYAKYSKAFGGPREDLQAEIKFQSGLQQVELSSISEMERLLLFRDVPEKLFHQQAEKVALRPGFLEFLRSALDKDIPVVVLSINWSRVFIEAALAFHGVDTSKLRILVNDLAMDPSLGRATGRFAPSPSIRTGPDKLAAVQDLVRQCGPNVVYVGDSSTDLLSLLEVPLGVVMERGSVVSTLDRLKLPYVPLGTAESLDPHTLYVGNWNDLSRKIFGSTEW